MNGSFSFHSGCAGASSFTRSRPKLSWKYSGCSAQRVPSLSNVAMRSAAGTNSGDPCFVTFATKSTMDCFVVPSFQERSGSAACAIAVARDNAHESAATTTRRTVALIDLSFAGYFVSSTSGSFQVPSNKPAFGL